MLKQKYFLTNFFILSAEKQPINSSWRKIEWLPTHREAKNRLTDMDWQTSPQNLLNRADKGALQLNKLIPALKSVALSEGSNVNVDETWLRYRTVDEKRKTYMWCLVNKKTRIVIFFYEDTEDKDGNQKHGGRSRNVQSDFIGDAKLKSLQSDGYNVYTCHRDLQAVGCFVPGLLLPPDTRIEKRKKRLRKPSSDDNLQIIIVKFAVHFLGSALVRR